MLVAPEHSASARSHVERLMKGVVFGSPVLFTLDDIFERLADARMQLWLFFEPDAAPHMFAITLVERLPQGNIAHVFLVAGEDFKSLTNFHQSFEKWAKMQEADYVHFECSPKMATIMKRFGYAPTAMAVYKSLHVVN